MSQIESDESLERSRLIKASVDPVLDYLAGCFASLQVMQRLRGAVDVVSRKTFLWIRSIRKRWTFRAPIGPNRLALFTSITYTRLPGKKSQWILLRANYRYLQHYLPTRNSKGKKFYLWDEVVGVVGGAGLFQSHELQGLPCVGSSQGGEMWEMSFGLLYYANWF